VVLDVVEPFDIILCANCSKKLSHVMKLLCGEKLLEELERLRPEALGGVCVLEELGVPTPLSLKNVSLAEEVLKSPEGFVLAMEPVGLLQVLRRLRMWEEVPSLAGSVVVLMDPEPRESIKEVEESALRAWLRSFGRRR
jgi:hypothetical protein